VKARRKKPRAGSTTRSQASNVLISSIEKDEYDRVDGLEKEIEIWETF
jgi:hypothetical protein